MPYKPIQLDKLLVNPANDRHGELENESFAIAWLFNNRELHMRNLAKDIVKSRDVYEPPLVAPERGKFVVFDGNRRVTCLKILADPKRAPTAELRLFLKISDLSGQESSQSRSNVASRKTASASTKFFTGATRAARTASVKVLGMTE